MGDDGFEPPTTTVSEWHSYQTELISRSPSIIQEFPVHVNLFLTLYRISGLVGVTRHSRAILGVFGVYSDAPTTYHERVARPP